jgi:hypothetical protein
MALTDGLDDSIVKFGAELFDGLVGAVGPGAIRQQGDRKLAVGIDPEGRAGVAEVSEGATAEIFPRLRW